MKEVLDALKARYRVEILFEDKVIEGYSLPANSLSISGDFESLLERTLLPFNLRYKRVRERTYLIMGRKVGRKTVTLSPNSRLAENTTSTVAAALARPIPAVTDQPTSVAVEPTKPRKFPFGVA
ncbi:hypothetical protein GO730_21895 [Spirosoma sp. HMF3257]|uniref:DUF4974 domain-containing protein n=1 Tax=Spirosoma telluris TaxID=2183553 RepID=A0A327NN85_9BACT|nr:hypothetical protein [Spirosoma telluris]RAI76165.1 hypothetical protein HMF3257_21820 [Spirosoma telluris]